MANKYITLASSDASISEKFKAIGMKVNQYRMDSIEWTLSGNIDKAAGPVVNQWQFVLRVPQTSSEAGYGQLSDLQALFALSNSKATPSDKITFTDHYGTSHYCYFTGSLSPEPLTTILEGPSAWHIVQITLQEIP